MKHNAKLLLLLTSSIFAITDETSTNRMDISGQTFKRCDELSNVINFHKHENLERDFGSRDKIEDLSNIVSSCLNDCINKIDNLIGAVVQKEGFSFLVTQDEIIDVSNSKLMNKILKLVYIGGITKAYQFDKNAWERIPSRYRNRANLYKRSDDIKWDDISENGKYMSDIVEKILNGRDYSWSSFRTSEVSSPNRSGNGTPVEKTLSKIVNPELESEDKIVPVTLKKAYDASTLTDALDTQAKKVELLVQEQSLVSSQINPVELFTMQSELKSLLNQDSRVVSLVEQQSELFQIKVEEKTDADMQTEQIEEYKIENIIAKLIKNEEESRKKIDDERLFYEAILSKFIDYAKLIDMKNSTKISELEAKSEEKAKEITELQIALEAKAEALKIAKAEAENQAKELQANLEAKAEELKIAKDEAEKQKVSLESQVKELQTVQVEVEKQAKELQTELNAKAEELQAAKVEVEAQKVSLESQVKELQTIQAEAEKQAKELQIALEAKAEEKAKEITALQTNLEAKNEESKKQVEELKIAKDEAEKQAQELQTNLEVQAQELQVAKADAEGKIQELESQAEELQTVQAEAEAQKIALEAKTEVLQAELNVKTEELQVAKADAEGKIQELESQAKELQTIQAEAETKIQEKTQELGAKAEELKIAKAEAENQAKELQTELNVKTEALQIAKAEVENQAKELQTELNAKTEALQIAKDEAEAQKVSLEFQAKELQTIQVDTDIQAQALQIALESQVKELQTVQAESENQAKELQEELNVKTEALQTARADAEKQAKELQANLEAKTEALQAAKVEVEAQKVSLEFQAKELQTIQEEAEKQAKELQTELNAKAEELQIALEAKAEALQTAKAEVEAQKVSLESQAKELQTIQAEAEKQAKELQANLEAKAEELKIAKDEAEKQKVSLEFQAKELQTELNAKTEALQTAKNEAEKQKISLESQAKELQTVQVEVEKQAKELQTVQVEVEKQAKELQTELNAKAEELQANLEAKAEELKIAKDEAEKQKVSLEFQAKELQTELNAKTEALQTAKNEAEKQKISLESQVKELQTVQVEVEKQAKELQTELNAKAEELQIALEAKTEALQIAKDEAEKQKVSLESQAKELQTSKEFLEKNERLLIEKDRELAMCEINDHEVFDREKLEAKEKFEMTFDNFRKALEEFEICQRSLIELEEAKEALEIQENLRELEVLRSNQVEFSEKETQTESKAKKRIVKKRNEIEGAISGQSSKVDQENRSKNLEQDKSCSVNSPTQDVSILSINSLRPNPEDAHAGDHSLHELNVSLPVEKTGQDSESQKSVDPQESFALFVEEGSGIQEGCQEDQDDLNKKSIESEEEKEFREIEKQFFSNKLFQSFVLDKVSSDISRMNSICENAKNKNTSQLIEFISKEYPGLLVGIDSSLKKEIDAESSNSKLKYIVENIKSNLALYDKVVKIEEFIGSNEIVINEENKEKLGALHNELNKLMDHVARIESTASVEDVSKKLERLYMKMESEIQSKKNSEKLSNVFKMHEDLKGLFSDLYYKASSFIDVLSYKYTKGGKSCKEYTPEDKFQEINAMFEGGVNIPTSIKKSILDKLRDLEIFKGIEGMNAYEMVCKMIEELKKQEELLPVFVCDKYGVGKTKAHHNKFTYEEEKAWDCIQKSLNVFEELSNLLQAKQIMNDGQVNEVSKKIEKFAESIGKLIAVQEKKQRNPVSKIDSGKRKKDNKKKIENIQVSEVKICKALNEFSAMEIDLTKKNKDKITKHESAINESVKYIQDEFSKLHELDVNTFIFDCVDSIAVSQEKKNQDEAANKRAEQYGKNLGKFYDITGKIIDSYMSYKTYICDNEIPIALDLSKQIFVLSLRTSLRSDLITKLLDLPYRTEGNVFTEGSIDNIPKFFYHCIQDSAFAKALDNMIISNPSIGKNYIAGAKKRSENVEYNVDALREAKNNLEASLNRRSIRARASLGGKNTIERQLSKNDLTSHEKPENTQSTVRNLTAELNGALSP
ncbi:hypothetical protein FZC35_00875 [Candidatus Cytomitobacter indipagum]|uniref:Uncharacterized protein n=1 Tax=Candidatus Cytomitobacter indipagum TaxID=2601575 RepID=A0A5C0UD34_9PROT|nr:hypothetical protein [Candidatus Cytomitobacter indipagum]QEK37935.1 hypothetical protein FZC35_00875 [Candidatus Cytomitobacter indipagum]